MVTKQDLSGNQFAPTTDADENNAIVEVEDIVLANGWTPFRIIWT